MGNTCASQYKTPPYSAIEEDGAPHYRPRTKDSRISKAHSERQL